jgi:hypothetical protein
MGMVSYWYQCSLIMVSGTGGEVNYPPVLLYGGGSYPPPAFGPPDCPCVGRRAQGLWAVDNSPITPPCFGVNRFGRVNQ